MNAWALAGHRQCHGRFTGAESWLKLAKSRFQITGLWLLYLAIARNNKLGHRLLIARKHSFQ